MINRVRDMNKQRKPRVFIFDNQENQEEVFDNAKEVDEGVIGLSTSIVTG